MKDALAYCRSKRLQLLDKFYDDTITIEEAKELKALVEKDKEEAGEPFDDRGDFEWWFACICLIYQLDKFIIENNTPKKRIYRLLGKI